MILKITAEKENTIAYTLDTKAGEILNDPQAVVILERYAPGTSKNLMLEMALSVLGGVNKLKKYALSCKLSGRLNENRPIRRFS